MQQRKRNGTRRAFLGLAVVALVATPILGHVLDRDTRERAVDATPRPARLTAYVSPEAQAADLSVQVFLEGLAEAEWYAGVQAELDRQAAAAAAAEAARASAPPTLRSGYSGPHSDAWWWGVAICEQGGRNDPYFGYFSFMDGSQGGRSWEEQVAAGNALLERAGREVGPWAASCVAAGYRASPEG